MTTSLDAQLQHHAPHVDSVWANAFILEMRLRGVDGASLGAALSEVESHMAEQAGAGRGSAGPGSVADVFGNPKTYAASLELPDSQQWTPAQIIRLCATLSLAMVAASFTTSGLIGLLQGGAAHVTWTTIGAIIVANLLVTVTLIARGEAIIRFVLDHPVWGVIAFALAFAAIVPLAVVIPGPVTEMPAGVALGCAVLAIVAIVVPAVAGRRRGETLDDRIVFPQG